MVNINIASKYLCLWQYEPRWILIFADHSCICDALGVGEEGDTTILYCDEEKSGQILYKCTKDGWTLVQYNCVLKSIKFLLDKSEVQNLLDFFSVFCIPVLLWN